MKKPSGGHRAIVKAPVLFKARHVMIREIVGATFENPEWLYGAKGKGRDDLVARVKRLLHEGYTHIVHADIRSCFDNINEEALYSLPLKEGVIDNNLRPDNLHFVQLVAPDDINHDHMGPAREETRVSVEGPIGVIGVDGGSNRPQGLMQGSPASNMILAYLLKDLRVGQHEDAKTMLYADDFIIMAKSEAALAGECYILG